MRVALLVIGLAVTLAGLGVACGPEQKYCYDEHKTCEQALIDKKAKEQEEKDRIEAERADAGIVGDGGATVIGQ